MSDRKALIRHASTLPKGSDRRRAILAGLKAGADLGAKLYFGGVSGSKINLTLVTRSGLWSFENKAYVRNIIGELKGLSGTLRDKHQLILRSLKESTKNSVPWGYTGGRIKFDYVDPGEPRLDTSNHTVYLASKIILHLPSGPDSLDLAAFKAKLKDHAQYLNYTVTQGSPKTARGYHSGNFDMGKFIKDLKRGLKRYYGSDPKLTRKGSAFIFNPPDEDLDYPFVKVWYEDDEFLGPRVQMVVENRRYALGWFDYSVDDGIWIDDVVRDFEKAHKKHWKTAKGWTRSFIYQGVDSQTGRHEYTLESMTRVVTHEVRVKEEWDAMARALAKIKKLKKEGWGDWGRGGMNRYEGMVGNEMEIRAWKGYIRIAVSVSWGGEGKPPTVQLWR